MVLADKSLSFSYCDGLRYIGSNTCCFQHHHETVHVYSRCIYHAGLNLAVYGALGSREASDTQFEPTYPDNFFVFLGCYVICILLWRCTHSCLIVKWNLMTITVARFNLLQHRCCHGESPHNLNVVEPSAARFD